MDFLIGYRYCRLAERVAVNSNATIISKPPIATLNY